MIAQHGISLGGLDLVLDGQPVVHAAGFTTEVSADGTTWGNAEEVVAQVISALADGDIVAQTHVGNRQPVLYVRVSAASAGLLALGEKALASVVGKPVELVWQPPDILDGEPTVFDVLHSRMDFTFDDMAELRLERAYVLTLTALPRPRSATKVETPAVAVAATSVIDSGAATTNWTAPDGPTGATVTVVSGAVTATYDGALLNNRVVAPFYGTTLRRTAAIDTSVNKFIVVDWKTTASGLFFVSIPGAILVEHRREPAPAVGFTRSWYRVPNATTSVASLDVTLDQNRVSQIGSKTLSVDQVLSALTLPISGTARQLSRGVDPAGSVPAEGDVLVQHATAGLGQALVYSYEAGGGYTPPISQWRTTSNTPTVDATTVSGQRISLITTPAHFEIPIDSVPRGDVQLWARLRVATGAGGLFSVFYGAGSAIGGAVLDAADQRVNVTLPGSAAWAVVPIARLTLPSRHMGPDGNVRIALLRDSAVDLEMDEAWLFGMDKGRLTVVDCGTGTPATGTVHNRLRVIAPSLEAPFGRIEVATAADWSDSFTPDADDVLCDQTGHRFHPDGSSVFTVTSGTVDAAVSLSHYPRWHSHAGTV